MHDRERQKCYDAEIVAFAGTRIADDVGFDRCVEISERVTSQPWWFRSARSPRVKVTRARSDALKSSSSGPNIRISRIQENVETICHELAHSFSPPGAGHGGEFRGNYIAIVANVCGTVPAERLRDAFISARLEVIESRIPLSDVPLLDNALLVRMTSQLTPERSRGAILIYPAS